MKGDKIWEAIKELFPGAQEGVPMARYTTFKIGGPAKYFVSIKSVDELQQALALALKHSLNYFMFGGGSNMLVADEGFDGMAIKIEMNAYSVADDTVVADAGVVTAILTRAAIDAGLTGFEWGIGVPGTIGGAVRGNAGAFGGEMKDVVESAEALVDGEVHTFSNAECKFRYRHSIFKENGGIVVGVTLKLKPDAERGGVKKMMEYLDKRNKTQPKGAASTGCIFKNYEFPPKVDQPLADAPFLETMRAKSVPEEFLTKKRISAGWLIEQVGMKGAKVGGAEVSAAHGNFIVNSGHATAADVRTLIVNSKEKVAGKFGIDLEEEIQYIGF
ncbi:UDP-N-acetylenolpyruvoylglucosamine reductase [Candidatus Uhrbacteria bacterium RIFCSPLOWO2_02_FULL_51_9]|uniref:UDP-N-acetylenolpyruvoylglucosamine reductase n=1 Tax=Candidatus Uhrbacteria bacterium RIFCSPLOWO2_02_FULL_51_9 TaxID=1802410 RepID=A0A1F7VD63_9BACT|nr:MAG: UDP-N-acetylenolpyruvoylglucosamine reductase [Candidatus Uhrbacteria bacterium RIFCSPLOWO2_02_FULL_51_9]